MQLFTYELAFQNSLLFSVRAGWFVSTFHFAQRKIRRVCSRTQIRCADLVSPVDVWFYGVNNTFW